MRTTFSNFSDVATALGFKVKKVAKKEQTQTCPKCGNELRNIPGTNVWMCDWATLEDKTTKDGADVQVFTACGNRVLASD